MSKVPRAFFYFERGREGGRGECNFFGGGGTVGSLSKVYSITKKVVVNVIRFSKQNQEC